LKIILLSHRDNYVKCLLNKTLMSDESDKTMKAVKSFNILATGFNVLHNYFDGPKKIIFRSLFS